MENNTVLLSICIPTYNRASFLKAALENIVSDPSFNRTVEIVISDNASTDNTSQIVMSFCDKYNNIKYYKNDTNVKDLNFYLSLTRGTGRYLRLFNDTLRLKTGTLKLMLDKISASEEKYPLFFFQNISALNRVNTSYVGDNINSFIGQVSYYTTWIANFGCWKNDLNQIVFPNRYSGLKLSQVDWIFQIIEKTDYYLINFGDYFTSIPPAKKGGYNIFNVFVNNYLYILKQYDLDFKSRFIEKNRLLKYFVMQWMWDLYIDKDKFFFETNNKWDILFRHYYLYPTFYFEILKFSIKKILNKLGL